MWRWARDHVGPHPKGVFDHVTARCTLTEACFPQEFDLIVRLSSRILLEPCGNCVCQTYSCIHIDMYVFLHVQLSDWAWNAKKKRGKKAFDTCSCVQRRSWGVYTRMRGKMGVCACACPIRRARGVNVFGQFVSCIDEFLRGESESLYMYVYVCMSHCR